jgi:asparagine synthase (glutamine-hydrolysing)
MSMQAGVWHYDQRPIGPQMLAAFEERLRLQGPDARGQFETLGFAMLHRAFYITEEDALETQPVRSTSGSVLTWDGRLDNRNELRAALGRSVVELPTDAEIVSVALDAWGAKALPKLIGDWAIAYWKPEQRRLLLARDYIGVRKLYYLATNDSLFWSTDLAALVLHSRERFSLCDPYFAGYFSSYPEPHLTPYKEIQLVPPGGYLEVTPHRIRVRRYWSFNSLPDLRYRCDAEYEEHFRQVFRESVRRRLRSTYPILADLSGGLDSSSIVCMAHDIIRKGEASANINTLSYYSLEEPGGDERPYFDAVEQHIGKRGTHIESRSDGNNTLGQLREPYFSPLPGYFDRLVEGERRLMQETATQGNRVHFSGLGGDELLGGVQNPVPDLAWLLWHLRLPDFLRQLIAWSLQRKTTVWSLLSQSIVSLTPVWVREHLTSQKDAAPWIWPDFEQRHHVSRRRTCSVADWRGFLVGPPSPDSGYLSLAANIAGYLPPFSFAMGEALCYYDRDLVQFLLAIPGEQLLRAYQRRSLMRRGLKGIVPDVVLTRKTKSIGRRVYALELLDNASALAGLLAGTAIAERYVDPRKVQEDFERLRHGKEAQLLLLERVLGTCVLYHDLLERQLWQQSVTSSEISTIGPVHCRRRQHCNRL